jgi:hypothetical protein
MILLMAAMLFGCASVNGAPDVRYYDISPEAIGCTVYCESSNPSGVQIKTVDRYLIGKDGKVQPVKQDFGTATGPVGSFLQSVVSSGSATAVMTPIAGALFPAKTSTTTNVSVSGGAK